MGLVKSRQNLLNSHLGRALFRNKLWNIRCSTVFHSRLWNSLDHSCVPRYVPEMFHNRHVPGRHGTLGNGVPLSGDVPQPVEQSALEAEERRFYVLFQTCSTHVPGSWGKPTPVYGEIEPVSTAMALAYHHCWRHR